MPDTFAIAALVFFAVDLRAEPSDQALQRARELSRNP
jgi:hypothetical protein